MYSMYSMCCRWWRGGELSLGEVMWEGEYRGQVRSTLYLELEPPLGESHPHILRESAVENANHCPLKYSIIQHQINTIVIVTGSF
jgi:hypothetical protein